MNVLASMWAAPMSSFLPPGKTNRASLSRARADATSRWSRRSSSWPAIGNMMWCRSAIPGPVLHDRPISRTAQSGVAVGSGLISKGLRRAGEGHQ